MKIRKLTVNGFRCLVNFTINFADDLTIVVGENDAGKSSLIECLKLITQGESIELDDFNHNLNEIAISLETDDFTFKKSFYKKDTNITQTNLTAFPSPAYITRIVTWLSSDTIDITEESVIQNVKQIAKTLGITVRSNSNIQNLRTAIVGLLSSDNIEIKEATFPLFNNIQLNGRHFENVSGFFKEVFLKGKQSEIWDEKINEDQTIEEFVKEKINSYSQHIEESIKQTGILGRMQMFLRHLTSVKIEPIYQKRDLNIDAKVQFMEGGKEVSIDKKGDGTKRRITMALLEYKKEQALLDNDTSTIYLLDEPDTHLHVKAQIEFLDTIKGFSENGNQVILTTHSPFIINAVCPRQLRLIENTQNVSKVRYLKQDVDLADRVLRSLGVENTYLFFSRHIVIVEGETEEQFLPAFFLKRFNETLSSSLIKLVNCKGITNIPGFARAILEIHNPSNIHLLYDNDASPELSELIENLKVPTERKYVVGIREFEDAFSDEALHSGWSLYLQGAHKDVPDNWTVDSIRELRQRCLEDGSKFSKEIRSLNQGGKKMSKPILGNALAENLTDEQIPQRLLELIRVLRE
ncbi:ATP-dependent nuclease [Shewanella fodinae]|uniref:ATP-dependent nuclease n=1 Tax=Shewanella fodinae TaxID=552357 RepID=UPI00167724CD|nr:AAA family ATPase [Shewanella fodinae]MCL2906476.1 AAA family ATPase [Shewanella fodinae]GGY93467.1 ATP-dependent endonuclease [Shewanella fodinae]